MHRKIAILLATAALGWGANAKAGKAVYDASCKSCHGPDGTANAAIGKMLKVEMRDLKSSEVQAMPADSMKKIVTEGKGKMMPVKAVTGAAVDDVVAYVHTLGK
jgi:mono/diheme cytochrome c family protein